MVLGSGGEITNCYSVGGTNDVFETGGIVLSMERGSKISNSYFYNTTLNDYYFFGQIAYANYHDGVIENCYGLNRPTTTFAVREP